MNLNADQRKLVVFLGKMKLRELNSPFSSNVETFFLTFFKTFLKLFLTSPPPTRDSVSVWEGTMLT